MLKIVGSSDSKERIISQVIVTLLPQYRKVFYQ